MPIRFRKPGPSVFKLAADKRRRLEQLANLGHTADDHQRGGGWGGDVDALAAIEAKRRAKARRSK